MRKLMKVRKYQLFGFTGLALFYFFVYRKFLHPKSVMNSVAYHNAVKFINHSHQVRQTLGTNLLMMTCNGKNHPLLNTCNFDLIVFGSHGKGKFNVKSAYDKESGSYNIKYIDMITKSDSKVIYE